MKKEYVLLMVMVLLVAFYMTWKKKNQKKQTSNKGKKNNKETADGAETPQTTGKQVVETANDADSQTGKGNSIEDLYNPHYSVSSAMEHYICAIVDNYGHSINCIQVNDASYKYNLTKERMNEIIHYVEAFVKDICNVPDGFMTRYIEFFKNCNREELSFASDVIELKGYVITDANGDKTLIEGFEDVLTDPLQCKRPGIEEWQVLLKKLN